MLAPSLEARIVEERMVALDPRDEPPDLPNGARVITMDQDGRVAARWEWPGSVRWWDAAAWRAEDELGNSIDARRGGWPWDEDDDY